MTIENSVAAEAVDQAPEATQEAKAEAVTETDKKMLTINYILFALGFLTAVTFIAGVVVAYIKRGEAETPVASDHYRWQIRTFWFSALWSVLGVILSMVVVGYFVLLANAIWTIYRIAKGWIRLSSGKEAYA